MNRHCPRHEVFAFTISGKRGHSEHECIATAGNFVYDLPGEGHTLVAHEYEDSMYAFVIVTGPTVLLDDKGEAAGRFDVFDTGKMCLAHHEPVGPGAALIEERVR